MCRPTTFPGYFHLFHAEAKALKQPEVIATLAGLGVDPVGDTPVHFGAYINEELARWRKLITDADIKM